MASNDVVLLQDMVARARPETRRLLADAEHQAYFTARHFLANFRPSHDDLVSGIVDGEKDGGIDALYIFADSFCIRDDQSIGRLGRSPKIDLVLLQVKNTSGFTEPPIDKLLINLPELLELGRDDHQLAARYNAKVVEITRRFLDVYRNTDMPSLRVIVAFASLRADQVHPNIIERGKMA